MKILNIDAFSKPTQQISFGGVSYVVEEPSLQDFIDSLKASEELEAGNVKEVPLAESFEKAIAAISKAIPTLPIELIKTFKVPAMTAVLQFIRGDYVGEEAASAEDDTQKKPI